MHKPASRIRRFLSLVWEEITETSTEHGLFLKVFLVGKYLRGLGYTALGIGLLALIGQDIQALFGDLLTRLGISHEAFYARWLIRQVAMIDSHMIVLASILAFFYGFTGLLQAIGLHFRKRWAEYVTALAAAVLIPGEVYLLFSGVSFYKVFLLASNIVIVGYLIHVKGLFIDFYRKHWVNSAFLHHADTSAKSGASQGAKSSHRESGPQGR